MSTRSKKPAADQPSMFPAGGAAAPVAAAPEKAEVTESAEAQAEPVVQQAAAPAVAAPTSPPSLVPIDGGKAPAVRAPALVVADEDPFGLTADELAEVLAADGLGEASAEDFRIGYWVCNVLNREVELEDGTKIKTRRDQWWNTLTNRVVDSLEGVFVGFRKTHEFSRYNNKASMTERYCRSNDRVHGTALREFSYKVDDGKGGTKSITVQQGETRPCARCPQQDWYTITDPQTGDKRQVRDCSMLRNFVFFDLETNEAGVVRFKKSSAKAAVDWLSRYYLGKYKVMSPRIDPRTKRQVIGPDGTPMTVPSWRSYPLYSFVWKVSLTLDKSGNFALPTFEKVRQVTKDELMYWLGQAKFVSELSAKVIEEANKQEDASGVDSDAVGGAGNRADDPDQGGRAADDGFDDSKAGGTGGAGGGSGAPGDEGF